MACPVEPSTRSRWRDELASRGTPPSPARGTSTRGSRRLEDVVRTDAAEPVDVISNAEREAVAAADAALPTIRVALHLLDLERGVAGAREEPLERPVDAALHVLRKTLLVAEEERRELNPHTRALRRFARAALSSGTVATGPMTSPRSRSASDSRSPFCHASVHQ